ncbi:MAG: SDR family NAD(P)-dependent oxidoreductase, partial [Acidobacteriota bacterium]
AREAELMDPQHRLFLETSWQALEDAGYDAEVFDGSIGVYGGMNLASYLLHNLIPDPNAVAGSSAVEIRIRNDKDFLASLAAYKLGLTGPSLTVQSACSTSLVAVSQACQSLLNYQCDMALAGGVSLGCPPRAGYMQQAGVFSPDGHCRAFDAGAQGTVNGQGVGVVVLKRLASALADGDTIRAVIKGYAINNDGSLKVGFTAPSVEGQAEVVAMAQIFAGIDPETVSYVEAHGTGTPMGDPVEVEALTQVFSQSTDRKGFCALGSVKTNIGHLDAAAGVASLIKTTLALEHEILPPSLHFERPNPEIDLASTPFWVPTEPTPWPVEAGKPRRAGVSAFAVGGVNAHLVVEEAPPVEPSEPSQGLQLLPFSARSKAALEEVSRNLARHLEEHPELVLADVAHTLALGRRPFEHRRTVICRDTREAAEILASGEASRVASGLAAGGRRMVAFLFPGLGNHYPGMARELAEREPGFRDDIERCCRILETELGVDLRDALLAERSAGGAGQELDLRALLGQGSASAGEAAAGELQRTLNAQPALFVVEYALARLWLLWGIEPSALVGYSLGEYVAACLAGVFSLPDALRLIAWRARRIDALPEGAMLAVSLPEPELAAQLPATLSISAIVTPEVTVVGGSVPAVEQLEADLKARAITCRRLETTHAFHSTMMRPLVDSFTELVGQLSLEPPQIPFLSNVTGTWITAEQATDPRYWAEHLVAPVRFADAVEELWREPGRILVEVGPGQVLGAWALQHPASAAVSEPVVVATLPHAYDGESHELRLLHSLGRLWLAGVEPSWEALFAGQKRRRLPLPTYPFERQRYWIDPPEGGATLPGAYTRQGEDRAEASFEKRSEVADWLYAPVWRELPPAPWPPVGVAPKRWLLLPDAVGVADALAHDLEALGHEVETLGSAGDITDRLRSLRQAERFPEVIAHLPGVTGEEEGSADERETAVVERGFSSLLRLAQAISEVQPEAKLELMVVVDGLCDVTGVEPLEPLEATILGPARVIPQEYPGIVARTFDLAGATADPHAAARQLAAAFFDRETETDLVALRGRRRWVEGYRSIPVVADGDDAVPVKDEAVVLITGGLGGVGRVLAGRLARRARARLALVGRSAFPERAAWPQLAAEDGPQGGAIRELLAMEEAGAEVAVFQADVTDRQALEAVVADIRQRFGRLDGVVHAAGVYPEGMIQLKTPEAAAAVLAPKVRGTRVLTEVLAAELEAGLDFFVLCSSLTARLGGFGLVDHVAANAFLDAFAVRATERFGQTVRSVAWDTWLEVGQAARGAEQAGLGSAAVELQGEVFDHPLLERRSRDGENDVFHTRLEARRHWVVDEHRLGERRLLPGTAYLEMARAAFEAVENGGGPVVVEGLVFVEPLWVDEDRAKHMRLSLQSSQNGRRELRIESRSESDDWRENARATVRRGSAEHAPAVVDLQGITERLA